MSMLMGPVYLSEQAELGRLDAHFRRVLRDLHARAPSGLGRAQRRARALHLERLDAYRRRAIFPKNLRFPGRMLPHFIDEGGVRCAMAHLIEPTGAAARDLVHHVARTANYARIRDLALVPELVAWLEENGLTADEAARIQPTYCGTPAHNCLCTDVFFTGMLKGSPSALTDGGTGLLVSAVYGPVTGVQASDVVPLTNASGLGPSDIVYARWYEQLGSASVSFVASTDGQTVAIPSSACFYPQYDHTPGPLPVATLDQAASSASEAACEQVLVQYDAKWGEMQGDSSCFGSGGYGGTTSGSGGTTSGSGGSNAGTSGDSNEGCGCFLVGHRVVSAETMIALSAALLLYGTRRRARRR